MWRSPQGRNQVRAQAAELILEETRATASIGLMGGRDREGSVATFGQGRGGERSPLLTFFWFSLLTEGGDVGLNIEELMLLRIHCWGD